MSLSDNVHRLVNPHLTMGADGKPYAVPALLDQLDRAITGDTHNGNSSGNDVSLPISAGALALQQDIDRQACIMHAEIFGQVPHGLKAMLRWWDAYVLDVTDEQFKALENTTKKWVEDILNLVNPTRPPRRLTLKCPACSTLYHQGKPALQVHCYDPIDGHMTHIGTWTADCRACEAFWPPEQMPWLIRALTAKEPAA